VGVAKIVQGVVKNVQYAGALAIEMLVESTFLLMKDCFVPCNDELVQKIENI